MRLGIDFIKVFTKPVNQSTGLLRYPGHREVFVGLIRIQGGRLGAPVIKAVDELSGLIGCHLVRHTAC
jgi:hypothetical protein